MVIKSSQQKYQYYKIKSEYQQQQQQQQQQQHPQPQPQPQPEMDLFDFPDDYKPELTKQQMQQNTNYLLSHPLFMKQLPQNLQSNQHISALLTLKQDQDPNQVAQNLNKIANKKLSQNPNLLYNMKQAYQRYTQAISIRCPSPSINAKLHANRAQINLKLKNYGKVIQDCKDCLKYDGQYVKGYFRYGKALNALGRYQECVQLLEGKKQEEIKQIVKQAKQKLQMKTKQQQQKIQKTHQLQSQIQSYCQKKKWHYSKRNQPLPEGTSPFLIDNKLSIPLLILYPQFSQSDIIRSTFQQHKIKQYIKQPIETGLPWDHKKQYSMDSIEMYCQMAEGVLMKIPKQAKIGDILERVVFREALEVQVVRKGNAFYEKYVSGVKIV